MIDKQKGYLPSTTMRELIEDNAMLLTVISRFEISLGFGDANIEIVCRDSDTDMNTFLSVCNLLSGYKYNNKQISLSSLMFYLQRAHESFLEIEFPNIRYHLIDAINSAKANELSLLLIQYFDEYVLEVRRHMEQENTTVFKYINQLLQGEVDETFTFSQYSSDHDDTVEKLNELKEVFIYHYKQRSSLRLCSALLDIIECGQDLMSHFEVESKLLIPAVERLEKEVRSGLELEEVSLPHREIDNNKLSSLSIREREIIKQLALGKTNKEIADILNISVHTVATHRRNIVAKLNIHSAAGLTIFAILNHIVEIEDVKLL